MIQMPFTDSVFMQGEKETAIILFHAYTGSPLDFNMTARTLNKMGNSVICPTFKGHGTQDIYDILEASPDQWWIQAQEVLEWVNQHFSKILVFGLSLGGVFAARLLTLQYDKIIGGGSFNSPVVATEKIDLSKPFLRYAQYLYKKENRLTEYNEEDILSRHDYQMEDLQFFTNEFKFDLQRIEKPYLLVQSGKDELINPQIAYEIKDELINAEVDFQWFDHNTHVITINRDRKAFEQALISFIQRCEEKEG